jgi:hypothetical protein
MSLITPIVAHEKVFDIAGELSLKSPSRQRIRRPDIKSGCS